MINNNNIQNNDIDNNINNEFPQQHQHFPMKDMKESLILSPSQESSKWQLTQPYNSKKQSIFVFLIQICYIIIVFILIAVGIHSLTQHSDIDNHKEHMLTQWKHMLYEQFTHLDLSLTVGNCIRNMVLFKEKTNDKAYFYSNEGKELFLCNESIANKTNSYTNGYNITNELYINFLNHKHKNVHNVVLYDVDVFIKEENDMYVLKQLCVVINSTELAIDENYRGYKCNGLMPWYESYRKVNGSEIEEYSYEKMLVEMEEITIKVFDVNQPDVWEEMEREEYLNKNEDSMKGSGDVLIGMIIVLFGFWLYFKEYLQKENKRIMLLKQQIQMEIRKKHFDSEDENEKNYYYGSDKEDNNK